MKKEWGHIDEIGFPSNRRFGNCAGLNAAVQSYCAAQVTLKRGFRAWALADL
jgi:hypothetical protein